MYIQIVKDFTEWREKARHCLQQDLSPHSIEWQEGTQIQNSLFDGDISSQHNIIADNQLMVTVSKPFIEFAQKISYHRDPQKWALLYTALWRIVKGEKYLLALKTDTLMNKLYLMQKAVGRDIHKMKAFVRFTCIDKEKEEYYFSWYEPDHKIIKPVAPFFQQRFKQMKWSIVTPDGGAHWDGQSLQFTETDTNSANIDSKDASIALWQTYYRSIFNPARIKLKAMRREMPERFWKHMPETQMIPQLLQEAPQRVNAMIKHMEGLADDASHYLPQNQSLPSLQTAITKCQACPLHQCATQPVFGTGPNNASLMIIGEQPGNDEDLTGQPFVGPAGQLLNRAFIEANIDRQSVYLTNAVKHFKFKSVNHQRIHTSPHVREINACKPWLLAEINSINPKVIVCLGLTAVRALFSHNLNMKELRGKCVDYNSQIKLVATYHPSAVLRTPNTEQQSLIYQHLVNDLRFASSLIV